jgi:hypothetical protein
MNRAELGNRVYGVRSTGVWKEKVDAIDDVRATQSVVEGHSHTGILERGIDRSK